MYNYHVKHVYHVSTYVCKSTFAHENKKINDVLPHTMNKYANQTKHTVETIQSNSSSQIQGKAIIKPSIEKPLGVGLGKSVDQGKGELGFVEIFAEAFLSGVFGR